MANIAGINRIQQINLMCLVDEIFSTSRVPVCANQGFSISSKIPEPTEPYLCLKTVRITFVTITNESDFICHRYV